MDYGKERARMHQAESGRCRFVDRNLEQLHGLVERGIVVEVEHVKAHRTKKDKKDMVVL